MGLRWRPWRLTWYGAWPLTDTPLKQTRLCAAATPVAERWAGRIGEVLVGLGRSAGSLRAPGAWPSRSSLSPFTLSLLLRRARAPSRGQS
jgi:hypothetical protein